MLNSFAKEPKISFYADKKPIWYYWSFKWGRLWITPQNRGTKLRRQQALKIVGIKTNDYDSIMQRKNLIISRFPCNIKCIFAFIRSWLFIKTNKWFFVSINLPYRLDIYELLKRTSSRIVPVAIASRLAQEFRIVLSPKVKINTYGHIEPL